MPETHDLGRFYWHSLRYPIGTDRSKIRPERSTTRELEDPYRLGDALVLATPVSRRGLVLGRWRPAPPPVLEHEQSGALLRALMGVEYGVPPSIIAQWGRDTLRVARPFWGKLLDATLGRVLASERGGRIVSWLLGGL